VKRILVSTMTLALAATLARPVPAQDLASQIDGTWKLTSFTRQEVATGKVSKLYGDQPVGYNVYTKGGRVIVFAVAEGRKAPAKAEPTDAERIDLFKTMYAFSGNDKVEGNNKLVYRIDGSWNQSWTGTDLTRLVQIAGDKLKFDTVPFKSVLDGQEIVVTTTFERVE
jgi:hypothetical protein